MSAEAPGRQRARNPLERKKPRSIRSMPMMVANEAAVASRAMVDPLDGDHGCERLGATRMLGTMVGLDHGVFAVSALRGSQSFAAQLEALLFPNAEPTSLPKWGNSR